MSLWRCERCHFLVEGYNPCRVCRIMDDAKKAKEAKVKR